MLLREGRDLPVWGLPWQSNPWVRLVLGQQVVASRRDSETSTASRHGAPVWNQEVQFLVEDPEKQVGGVMSASVVWDVQQTKNLVHQMSLWLLQAVYRATRTYVTCVGWHGICLTEQDGKTSSCLSLELWDWAQRGRVQGVSLCC